MGQKSSLLQFGLLFSGILATQSSSKQGRHLDSLAHPVHGCPHACIFSHEACIAVKQSFFLQTSLNAGFILGDGYLSSSPQKRQEEAFC